MKRYPAYKDSGVEWIGEIPEEWNTGKLRYFFNILTDYTANGSFASLAENVKYLDGIGYSRLIRLTDLRENLQNDGIFVDEHAHNFLKKSELFGDEILIANVGAYAGYVCKMPEINFNATLGPNMYLMRFKTDIFQNDYIRYLLQSNLCQEQLSIVTTSTAQPKLNKDNVKDITVILPLLKEQYSISNFLDHKTHQIDILIEKKQKQIELLKEQRTAIINHAVTKGLNPNVKMKDSGIEWLGEVPEHWKIQKTKYLFELSIEKAPENNEFELLSIYTDIGVRPRKELEERGNKASTTDGYFIVEKGDIIVNKLLAWMGAIGCSVYDGVTSPAYDILRKIKLLNSFYYHYLFRGGLCLTEFKKRSRGIMDMRLRLYFDEFGQILLPYPPEDEQNSIVEYIKNQVEKVKSLIAKQQEQIQLLKEYRTTLISEVVTGKIDVRDEVLT